MKYNFKEYLPNLKYTHGIPSDVISITDKAVSIGYDIAVKYKGFLENPSEDDKGRMYGVLRFGIQHDEENNVIRLFPSKLGYVFKRQQSSIRFINANHLINGKTRRTTIHGKIKPGIYKLVPGETDIYGLEE